MSQFDKFEHPFSFDPKYSTRVAYFCMEFAIDQALKIYAGGLGYLAGSHMRSAYSLKQNMVGIGIKWNTGYYDQVRKTDQSMDVLFMEKNYPFLEDTGIVFDIEVNDHPVAVKAFYLPPGIFNTAPLFLLSTDLPQNDYLSRSICHRLYDSNVETKVAQYMLLGIGGAKLLDIIGYEPEVYHINEAHGLPAAFYLYKKWGDFNKVKEKVVVTTHTPVPAGNEQHDIRLLEKLGFFCGTSLDEIRQLTHVHGETFNQTLVALRFARIANGVSKIHGRVARKMWGDFPHIAPITHITNAQNKEYWVDKLWDAALRNNDNEELAIRKQRMKVKLFDVVADQAGQLFDPKVLTIVWARRFAGYKRADILTKDIQRFTKLMNNPKYPVQLIWAGKPYPTDYQAVSTFDSLVHISKQYRNCAVLTGYELSLSKLLKQGADIWLNTPRVPREASGTSGMTAAMNGAVNLSTADGWIPEFARDGINSFVVPLTDELHPEHIQDDIDRNHLYEILEQKILPAYYDQPDKWWDIVKNTTQDIMPFFDSDRMAHQYYEKLYTT